MLNVIIGLVMFMLIILFYMIYDSRKRTKKQPKMGWVKSKAEKKKLFFKKGKKQQVVRDELFDVTLPVYEKILVSALLFVVGFFIAWSFYRSLLVSVVAGVFFQFFQKIYLKEKRRKLKAEIIDEFVNLNNLLLAELQAGIAVNLAYQNLAENIKNSDILKFPKLEKEINSWINRMNLGDDINDILLEFAKRSDEPCLIQFANMLDIAVQRGGNILSIILSTNAVLNDERQMMYDIEVMITEKKLEQKVLTASPIFILIFLNYTAFDFIAPLYQSIVGRITMTILLGVFIVSYLWSKRITVIK